VRDDARNRLRADSEFEKANGAGERRWPGRSWATRSDCRRGDGFIEQLGKRHSMPHTLSIDS